MPENPTGLEEKKKGGGSLLANLTEEQIRLQLDACG